MSLLGKLRRDLPDFDVDGSVKKNNVYFVSGQNNYLGDELMRLLVFQLRKEGAKDISCFCPDNRRAFYTTFIPPAFVSSVHEKSIGRIFDEQEKNMAFCDEKGTDPNQREALKATFSRILIIDRAKYFDAKEAQHIARSPVLNNGLMHCAKNYITVIYRNISNAKWTDVVPSQVLNSSNSMCFIVGKESIEHIREAKRYFGGIDFESLKIDTFSELLASSDALNPERGSCAVISKRPITQENGEAQVSKLREKWTFCLAKFTVPLGNLSSFKFGDIKLWSNYGEKPPVDEGGSNDEKSESSTVRRAKFNPKMIDLLNNLLKDNDKVRMSIVSENVTNRV